MFTLIKKNPLLKFFLRISIVLTLSAIFWIIAIFYYYEEQVANKLHDKIVDSMPRNIELFKRVDFENKNSAYYELLEFLDDESQKAHTVYFELFNEDKKLLIEKKYSEYESLVDEIVKDKTDKISSKINHIMIPSSSSNIYFYYQDKISILGQDYYVNILKTLDEALVKTAKDEVYLVIFVVVLTILILTISVFPIIYSQYKDIIDKKNELVISQLNILTSLGNAVAKRDSDTNEHNYRVTFYSIKIAQLMHLSDEKIESLIKGSFLHDIGKIAISDNILLKPGKLTKEEFEVMKTHVNHGVDIVDDIPWLEDAKKVIHFHHEKVDGSGYPNAVKKENIPIEARIFAVADVFDALSSKRPYKEAMCIHKSISILQNDSNTHFDEEVVKVFKTVYEELFKKISTKDSKELKKLFKQLLSPYFLNN